MGVYVCRGAEIGVAKEDLGELMITGLVVDDAARTVAEGVEAGLPREPLDSESVKDRVKHVLAQNIRVQRRPVGLTENEILSVTVLRRLFVSLEDIGVVFSSPRWSSRRGERP